MPVLPFQYRFRSLTKIIHFETEKKHFIHTYIFFLTRPYIVRYIKKKLYQNICASHICSTATLFPIFSCQAQRMHYLQVFPYPLFILSLRKKSSAMKNVLAKISNCILDTQQKQYSVFNLLEPSHCKMLFISSWNLIFHQIPPHPTFSISSK